MKKPLHRLLLWAVCLASAAIALAATPTRLGSGKNFLFPDYYPATSGVVRKKSLVSGAEYRLVTNNLIALTLPRFEFFKPDGSNLEWVAIAPECLVNIDTREVSGTSNVYFRTADERLYLAGMGFLWQQSNSVLMLSNNSFTWIEVRTNTAARMKAVLAATLVATTKLSAAEIQMPPSRPGLTITSVMSEFNLRTYVALFSNDVLVTYPPDKSNEAPTTLRCNWAVAKRGTNNQIEEVVAHGRVAIDKGEQHARGNYAVYTASNEMAALVGPYDPADATNNRPYLYASYWTNGVEVLKWKDIGEAILFDRRRGTLRTMGATVHVPGESLKGFSVPGETNKPSPTAPQANPTAK